MDWKTFAKSREELEKLYQTNSCSQIAQMFNITAEPVRLALIKHGIPRRAARPVKTFDPPKEQLRELYQSMSMADIAKHFGVGETVVFKRLKEHGIELNEHVNHRLKPGKVFSEEHRLNLRNAHLARDARGEKNPNWKGGTTAKNFLARSTVEYRDWKRSALQRAGHKCQQCGAVGGSVCECCGTKVMLHVHHIKSFAKYPDERFNVENSEVLCPKCHHSRHRSKIG